MSEKSESILSKNQSDLTVAEGLMVGTVFTAAAFAVTYTAAVVVPIGIEKIATWNYKRKMQKAYEAEENAKEE